MNIQKEFINRYIKNRPRANKTEKVFKSALYSCLYGGSSKQILRSNKISKRRYKIWYKKRYINFHLFKEIWN